MYSVKAYGRMISDTTRINAYVSAMRAAVRPGDLVIDLGCGPGLFALLACKLGARRVYAIEPSNIIQLARESARANGFLDRVEFFQDVSTNVNLPEPADVIVSDLRGVLPLFQRYIPTIRDARVRLLKPGGILIPTRDTLYAAVAEAPILYESMFGPWGEGEEGISLTAVRRVVANSWTKAKLPADSLLSETVCWHTLDYCTAEDPDVRAEISLSIRRAGTAHGFAIWFDTELLDGIGFTNGPGSDNSIYSQGFFPFPEPVAVEIDDEMLIQFRADLIQDDYVWTWNTRICNRHRPSELKANFKQSTLSGAPLTPSQLHKREATFLPTASEEARLHSFVLSKMNGVSSNLEIATEVVRQFPLRFPSVVEAVDFVAELSSQYSD